MVAVAPPSIAPPPGTLEKLQGFIRSRRVKLRTSLGHLRSLGRFREYLRAHHGTEDVFLRDVAGDRNKAELLALFYVHLVEEGNVLGRAHANVRAGVRRCFEAELVDVGFMELLAPRVTADSARRSTAESRAHAQASTQRARLPLPGDMEDALRIALRDGRSYASWEGRLALVTYAALRWGENHGLRASNITAPGPG